MIGEKTEDENSATTQGEEHCRIPYLYVADRGFVRANDCDVDRIEENIVSRYQVSDEEHRELTEWYANLASMMREEGVREKGHLQINRNVIINLTELHAALLASPKFPFYSSAYFKALPFIVELRNKNGQKEEPELETCFEALYGMMLLRLQKKPVSPETTKAMEAYQ